MTPLTRGHKNSNMRSKSHVEFHEKPLNLESLRWSDQMISPSEQSICHVCIFSDVVSFVQVV